MSAHEPLTPAQQRAALEAWRKLSPEERQAIGEAMMQLVRSIAAAVCPLRPILESLGKSLRDADAAAAREEEQR